ncbi:kinesin protein KIF23-like, partial [Tropilaelaps mercedesae]
EERIPVYLRLRPCSSDAERAVRVVDGTTVEISTPSVDGLVHQGKFNRIFDERASQLDVFRDSVLPLVENVLDRQRDALLIAYGASGSGKTYTISGSVSRGLGGLRRVHQRPHLNCGEVGINDSNKDEFDSAEGVLPLAIRYLFRSIETDRQLGALRPVNFSDLVFTKSVEASSIEETFETTKRARKRSSRSSCVCWLSVVQVYNEVVTDLLNPTNPKPLALSQDSNGRCFVRDVSWHVAYSEDDALGFVVEARRRQKVAATKLNNVSSRSHFIAFIKLVRRIDGDNLKVNQLVIADLAGNERATATGSTGNVLRQAGFINCSLLVLGRCVDAIRRGLRNIPYRESKLTRLLSPFLSGKGPLLSLLVCISTRKDRVDDTLASIKFSALASELTQPAEVVKRFQETRRKSANAITASTDCIRTDCQDNVVRLPAHIYQSMQEDLALGERLACDNENLRRSLQLAEEALENNRHMHQERMTAMREEYRAEVRTIRDEHRQAREAIESELHQHCNDLTEKYKKYKRQATLMADVLNKRLYPELEEYRSRYGPLGCSPRLMKEDLQMCDSVHDTAQDATDCSQCCMLKSQLDDALRQLHIKSQQGQRMIEELRSERELRVLLQEKTRVHEKVPDTCWDSQMDYTCRSVPVDAAPFDKISPETVDSGHETDQYHKPEPDDGESACLRQEIDELREKLLQQLAVVEHVEITTRDRITELEHQLKNERLERRVVEMARDQLVNRLK